MDLESVINEPETEQNYFSSFLTFKDKSPPGVGRRDVTDPVQRTRTVSVERCGKVMS